MSQEEDKLRILREILGSPTRRGSEYLYECPEPDCNHEKRKLSVNLKKNFFHCWICEWSGRSLYRILKRHGTMSQQFRWKSYENFIDISSFEEKLFPADKTLKAIVQRVHLPDDFISLSSKTLPYYAKRAMNYLHGRGLTKSDITQWKLGISASDPKYKERILVPSFGLNGYTNYFVGRTYVNDYFKYQNADAPKNIIFNHLFVDWDEDIILVEGSFDAFKSGTNSIPMLGSSLRENSLLFKEIVRHDSTVYLALDPDARNKQVKLINQLLEYDIEIYEIILPDGHDVGAGTKEDFNDLKGLALRVDLERLLQYNVTNRMKELNL